VYDERRSEASLEFKSMDDLADSLERAARVIVDADALLIGAGAGMGVDSGLPDFRGTHGFWRAYPPFRALGLDFMAIANPRWFRDDPELAWGFYGHRLNLYRATVPHPGFELLRTWCRRVSRGWFVFTSNVDGQFQRAGFDSDRIVECHGAVVWLQCLNDCGIGLFPAPEEDVRIDEKTMRARPPLPSCPRCRALARPNILMFGDAGWDHTRTEDQTRALAGWKRGLGRARLVIIECGAGQAIPSVRWTCEDFAAERDGTLIRINPREAEVESERHISLPMGAADALEAIDSLIGSARSESRSEAAPPQRAPADRVF
jgi:NAD-dependent SIR2 family protein deacetylase